MYKQKLAKYFIAATLFFAPISSAEAWPSFIKGHNICALNVNRLRVYLGLPQTHSASAKSFDNFKRVSQPKKGNVMVVRRKDGGFHVALFLGNGMCLNPSSKLQKHSIKPCSSIWKGQPRHYVS